MFVASALEDLAEITKATIVVTITAFPGHRAFTSNRVGATA